MSGQGNGKCSECSSRENLVERDRWRWLRELMGKRIVTEIQHNTATSYSFSCSRMACEERTAQAWLSTHFYCRPRRLMRGPGALGHRPEEPSCWRFWVGDRWGTVWQGSHLGGTLLHGLQLMWEHSPHFQQLYRSVLTSCLLSEAVAVKSNASWCFISNWVRFYRD